MPSLKRLLLLCGLLGGCAIGHPPANASRAVVFFQSWSAALDPTAQQVITNVAQDLKANPANHVWVFGYADLTGSVAANKLISATRAQVVTDQLLEDGIAPGRIEQAGRGETGTDPNEQQSRRVVLATAPAL